MVVNRIENRTKEYLDGEYHIQNSTSLPNKHNVYSGKKAYKTKICAFSIDLRNSTKLLMEDGRAVSGKVHKAFLNVVTEVINYFNGDIRDFQGDSVLAYWKSDKDEINKAVRAGLTINWFLKVKLEDYFKPYGGVDFGIGIDFGNIHVLKVGITTSERNNDLVYIGKCVNFAVGIANQLKKPRSLGISEAVYSNIDEGIIYSTKDNQRVNIWEKYKFKWKDDDVEILRTSYHCEISE